MCACCTCDATSRLKVCLRNSGSVVSREAAALSARPPHCVTSNSVVDNWCNTLETAALLAAATPGAASVARHAAIKRWDWYCHSVVATKLTDLVSEAAAEADAAAVTAAADGVVSGSSSKAQ